MYPVTGTLVSREEYLGTDYEPNCDWLDGVLLERNTGLLPHSKVMSELIYLLAPFEAEELFVLPVIHIRVSESRYRVADLCVIRRSGRREQIIETAPVLCVEIIAPEDGMSEMMERVDDYLAMGVKTVWLVDAWKKRAYCVDRKGMYAMTDELTVSGTAIRVRVDAIFAE